MRTIERTNQFKRDYKREAKGRQASVLEGELVAVLTLLMKNKPLEPRHHDHPLSNNWADHRDCLIKPDLVLIYRLPDDDTLQLVRLGLPISG